MTLDEFNKLDKEKQEAFLGKGQRFDRIRRVTGYLNPDIRTWNDGKQAEVAMRLKHRIDD